MISLSALRPRGPVGFHEGKSRLLQGSAVPRAFWKVLTKPEFPAHILEQAVLPLKPKKVAETAIYLSHGFYNFPGTFTNH